MSDFLRYLALAALVIYASGCGYAHYDAKTHDVTTFTLFKDVSAKVQANGVSVDLTSNTDEAAMKAIAAGAAEGAVKGMRP